MFFNFQNCTYVRVGNNKLVCIKTVEVRKEFDPQKTLTFDFTEHGISGTRYEYWQNLFGEH